MLYFSFIKNVFQGTIWYFSDLFDSLIRLLTVLTDPVMFPTSINGNLTKIDIYNKKVIEGFMLEYKQSFHSALLWVKLREKIAQFLRKESTKSSPGLTNRHFPFAALAHHRILWPTHRLTWPKMGNFSENPLVNIRYFDGQSLAHTPANIA